jgi:hypothetical protein
VFLKDNNGEFVAIGVCYSVSPDLVVGSKGPLGMSKVAIQIINVLVVEDRTSNWMFSLCAWNMISLCAFYGRASCMQGCHADDNGRTDERTDG